MSIVKKVEIEGRTIEFELQKFAKQANGSVMVSSGGTRVLVTVCAAEKADPSLDFFPLGVDYVEKAYSVGRIPGGFRKREGKPGDHEALTARVIDRPLRPCFPKWYRNETVISCTVMSYEKGHAAAPLALVGASTALMVSDIPFDGPVAALRIGMQDGAFIVQNDEAAVSDLELNIACKEDAILMVEAGASFLSEEKMIEAFEYAQKNNATAF